MAALASAGQMARWLYCGPRCPIGGSFALVSIYLQLPTVVLSWFVPDREVGLFGAANGTVSPFFMLPVALGTALLPALAQSVSNDKRTLRLHLRYTGLALVLGALVTYRAAARRASRAGLPLRTAVYRGDPGDADHRAGHPAGVRQHVPHQLSHRAAPAQTTACGGGLSPSP
ncbi:MAG: hypothetical protein HND48_03785 [Chloroflexi bacterium]|nr:hypothetical protein [Chloroflexota bacterium]